MEKLDGARDGAIWGLEERGLPGEHSIGAEAADLARHQALVGEVHLRPQLPGGESSI